MFGSVWQAEEADAIELLLPPIQRGVLVVLQHLMPC